MKPFMDENFLLNTETAKELYHGIASRLPIVDYHCHIDPAEIAADRKFDNITQVWLGQDHYKWRQMRSNGVNEAYITGDAPDREKFQKWAETLEKAAGNPLFHWSHLELQRFFGCSIVLNKDTAEEVWNLCNQKLRSQEMRVRNLIRKSNVALLCTTDDPADDLRYHSSLRADPSFSVQVLPAWRPDRALHLEKPDYTEYLEKLGAAAQIPIRSWDALKDALKKRMDFFHSLGCRVSDHGLEAIPYLPAAEEEIRRIFADRLSGQPVTEPDARKFKTALLLFLAGEYTNLGWVMQLHYGCRRDNNCAMYQLLGPDTGFDCIGDPCSASQSAEFLNALYERRSLPKTILYSLNPHDNEMLGSLIGCFQNGDAVGKLQQGSAWWFNDHKTGMVQQMTSLANLGLLGNFIGMLTDSRSFLSYPRHEYFRRILCDVLGTWVENGEYPKDMAMLGRLVRDISYNNAVRYFGFDLELL